MSQASDSTVWLGMFVPLTATLAGLLACALGSVLAALGQLPLHGLPEMLRPLPRMPIHHSRSRSCSNAASGSQPCWRAAALAATVSGVFAAGLGAGVAHICAAVAGALAGAQLVRRRNLARQPALVALVASGMGLAIVVVGVARHLSPPSSLPSSIEAVFERVELCMAVFAGALIFATSAIAFCKFRGVLPLRVAARRGHDVVNVAAFLLCGWLGYGFATEAVQPFGLAALLAISALASSIGVHAMLSREYSEYSERSGYSEFCECPNVHAHAHAARGVRSMAVALEWRHDAQPEDMREVWDAGMVRAAAYRHRRGWHNSGNGQPHTRASAARRLPNRFPVSRQP
ncbi:MAG: NAD(P) transhydrogenase subunit beta (EC [uncultured Paraburkholderia sp.]|uniref:NAD(P)(+) transhydrogenase (Re/Si-specific) subunit beta n=1 Tax=uncultured Paraburkholderia sp. TaxID=1822466 RepID=UPI002595BB6A|nr:NAD(P)(+) transhydrogenase (Re/Si-specific) subunit beta [uncultured Paraburkholderia sp.]CAH2901423.1 MAG: NAD(P) transhydrogenase subunit beta (EC [uncultured Paraburkholderia sp.]CAH2933887.1 MAG: NAD(P) transhydrogenase subunit beta (EC [uncultured Paraburkholderia sp.]